MLEALSKDDEIFVEIDIPPMEKGSTGELEQSRVAKTLYKVSLFLPSPNATHTVSTGSKARTSFALHTRSTSRVQADLRQTGSRRPAQCEAQRSDPMELDEQHVGGH